jgi:hypothetical protein
LNIQQGLPPKLSPGRKVSALYVPTPFYGSAAKMPYTMMEDVKNKTAKEYIIHEDSALQ